MKGISVIAIAVILRVVMNSLFRRGVEEIFLCLKDVVTIGAKRRAHPARHGLLMGYRSMIDKGTKALMICFL